MKKNLLVLFYFSNSLQENLIFKTFVNNPYRTEHNWRSFWLW